MGTGKHFFKVLINHGLLSDAHLSIIQTRVNSCVIPAGIGRIPYKLKSGFAEFTADQWKNWVVYFSTICMRNIITGDELECWRHFVLACRVLCCKHLTKNDVKLGDAFNSVSVQRDCLEKSPTCTCTAICTSGSRTSDPCTDFGAMPLKDLMVVCQTIIVP